VEAGKKTLINYRFMEFPLKGIRVMELANVLAGPSVGMFLAELGASVVKVENVRSFGDVTRQWKLPSEDPLTDISAYFSSVNWGKESLALDITLDGGLDVVQRLAEKSDILLSSYKPGDAEKLGVDYHSLKKFNPDIIYAHVTGYGMHNPRAGYDAIIQAESGFTFMNGEPDGPPVKMPVALMDVLAAHQVKEALLLALLTRERAGGGQYIEASLIGSGVASLVNQAANWLVAKTIPGRMGSDHPNIVPYGTIFTTSDGKHIVLAVGTDRQFARLCRILGDPGLSGNEKYTTNYNRVVNSAGLKDKLQELIGVHDRETILAMLSESRIPAGGVHDMREVFEIPEARAMLLEADSGQGSMRGVSSVAFTCDSFLTRSDLSPPPHYGQHSRSVLSGILGYAGDQIERLIETKTVYSADG
jgi:crotonobetainyl-CoA:carnitine CoA-transferase CaiB-like acyl-CoA transferase